MRLSLWRQHRHHESDSERKIAELQNQQYAMRHVLDQLLTVAAAAGSTAESAAADAVPGVPAPLVAAVRNPSRRPGGEPILLRGPGDREVIAVVGEYGNPRDWWAAINSEAATTA